MSSAKSSKPLIRWTLKFFYNRTRIFLTSSLLIPTDRW